MTTEEALRRGLGRESLAQKQKTRHLSAAGEGAQ